MSKDIHILKRGNCNNLSGKSKLTYQIGCDASGAMYFRLSSNDGGGFFSKEWVAWNGSPVARTGYMRHLMKRARCD